MLSIIIPVYNCLDYTKYCLESIRKHTKDYELIIVDNGSTDGTKDWFNAQKTAQIDDNSFSIVDGTVIVLNQNLGYSKANNIGANRTKGEYICFLNNDTIVTPNWDRLLIKHLENNLDMVGPCSNFVAGIQRRTIGFYDNPTALNDRSVEFTNDNIGKNTETNWIIGFCMVAKSELFKTIGLFDEQFRIGNSEDIDLCFKAKALGLKIGVSEDCYIHHFGHATFLKMDNGKTDLVESLCKENWTKLVNKWGNSVNYNQI